MYGSFRKVRRAPSRVGTTDPGSPIRGRMAVHASIGGLACQNAYLD
jgi:hypothetical protein